MLLLFIYIQFQLLFGVFCLPLKIVGDLAHQIGLAYGIHDIIALA